MLRRIESKKNRKKKLLVGGLLAFLMVFSMLGVILSNSTDDTLEYNEFKFSREESFFVTKINGKQFYFSYLPQNLLLIEKPEILKNKIKLPMIYLSFNPENKVENLRYIDLIRNDLFTIVDSAVVSAVSKESSNYLLPVISCENATSYVPVFYFNISNETSIIERNNCLIFNAQNIEILKLRDLIVYTYLGVIDG
ncbi:hypothetical protein CMO90_00220 [Candidatus Woesearchaeota archaeon]|jgi:hypothetical protein|nr:hypothetical protein [Candidatus Woesearchaeota archaeon]|tara:strand:- start:62 stop:646 length:585 start_codon:yes stop_codon:yes gene_type:complete